MKHGILSYCDTSTKNGPTESEASEPKPNPCCELQALEGRPLLNAEGLTVKRFHAYGPQWADMAAGSGYETVVHQAPLLKCAKPAPRSTVN